MHKLQGGQFEHEGMWDIEVPHLSAEEFLQIKCLFLVFNLATN